MNTLSKKITPIFFKEEIKHNCYFEVKKHWLALQNNQDCNLALEHHILYAILRGKDWRKCFTPITNEVKLTNGAQKDLALSRALYRINSHNGVFDSFAQLIDRESCTRLVRAFLQGRKEDAYNQFPIEKLLQDEMSVQA